MRGDSIRPDAHRARPHQAPRRIRAADRRRRTARPGRGRRRRRRRRRWPGRGHAGILLGDPTRVREALPRMHGLRWVQLTWAGVEPMLDPALRRDYVLTNIRGVFGPLMSEYVFGYLLAHERRILPRHEATRAGRWDATLPGTLQRQAARTGGRRVDRRAPGRHRQALRDDRARLHAGQRGLPPRRPLLPRRATRRRSPPTSTIWWRCCPTPPGRAGSSTPRCSARCRRTRWW